MRKTAVVLLSVAFLAALLIWSESSRYAVKEGLSLCAEVVVPSLFPFSVAVHTLIKTEPEDPFGLKHLLSSCRTGNTAAALFPILAGLLGGFPLGVQSVAMQYENKVLLKKDAERISAVCNQAGPAFILGAVGGALLGSVEAGIYLLLVNCFSVLGCFYLFCFRKVKLADTATGSVKEKSFLRVFPEAISDCANSMLLVTGTVVFFSVLSSILETLLPLRSLPVTVRAVLRGILELTNGVSSFAGSKPSVSIPLLSALIGWGGICVHIQAIYYLHRAGLSAKRYVLGKAAQALISGSLSVLALPFLLGRSSIHKSRLLLAASAILIVFLAVFVKQLWKKRKTVI